ncbi:MAG TPA: hypothetical protein VNO52_00065 [Methylomirabilota bacterium]|nr:hypothetical protein [Methylomirabilota bacterium]
MGRPAEIELSRPSPVEVPGTLDRVAEIERLSDLMIRESGSLRQTGEGSLAVVLRPDEQTQLFVEMAQREGYIEAQVRCERGDARHLGALWGQLQEALGQQNIRLAPLQDASGGGQAGSHGSPPLGTGDSADANADRHSPRQPVAEQHPWEERSGRRPAEGSRPLFRNPDPARSVAATVPGWETWA